MQFLFGRRNACYGLRDSGSYQDVRTRTYFVMAKADRVLLSCGERMATTSCGNCRLASADPTVSPSQLSKPTLLCLGLCARQYSNPNGVSLSDIK